MAKKKSATSEEDEYEVPTGKVDEDGDELIDLNEWKDDLEEDVIYEIPDDDDMIEEESEDEEFGMEVDDVVKMLRDVK
ncbi:MAG: hypothetical protein R3255_00620, partial [Candidatus Lokiarchaeia archaeon]|nr:hypothetical protein [Candidatus Lokiarchaeia archaeon]